MTIKFEIKVKRIQIALKLLSTNKKGTLPSDVINEALEIGTPWTDEVNEDIGDLYGNGKWLRTITNSEQLFLQQNWKKFDHRK